ncbi:MAG: prepilin-type N-terminal cleavage/methylation domain-containing protein [Candidatus Hydrogenedentes bacterium]|nr:prepilin-type N-terminal cleavage/methylation domain-containing protein [Candidatus Hydrogenedentota bacterium]
MKNFEAKGGFTLTELLVSTAIFALLMTSIGALFVASLHAMKRGYQTQQVMELSRGTFNVIERDLTTMFTSRDAGQYYQFYGNEYGMMMVGMLQLRDANGREYNRVGRVTYVIYPVVIRAPEPGLGFYVTQPFALDYSQKYGVQGYDPAQPDADFHLTRGMRFSPAVEGNPEHEIAVAALIRYVEPGVSDLDTYPFDWEALIQVTEGNPEFPQNTSSESIRSQLNDSLEAGTLSTSPSDDLNFLARLNDARDQMLSAKKRDLWLKMLSCQKYWIPKLVGGSPILPNPWGRTDENGVVTERCWLRQGSTTVVVNPRDFVAVDSLGVFTNDYWTTFPMAAYQPKSLFGYKPFFEFGRVTADTSTDLMPFWNANRRSYAGNLKFPNDGIDNDQDQMVDENGPDGVDNDNDGLIDEPDELGERMIVAGSSDPGVLLLDPNAFVRDGRDNDADGFPPDEPGEDLVHPIEADGIDNNFDGTIDEAGETIDSANLPHDPALMDQVYFSIGSPLQPRIPEVVLFRLPMIYPPAHFGAPTYERTMEQLVEVPTAYTRSKLAGAQP